MPKAMKIPIKTPVKIFAYWNDDTNKDTSKIVMSEIAAFVHNKGMMHFGNKSMIQLKLYVGQEFDNNK